MSTASLPTVSKGLTAAPSPPPRGGTRFPEFFADLAREFPKTEVKVLPKGKGLLYITARTAMIRLDEVCGPENWWDEYTILSEHSVMCRLTLRLPDGSTVTKSDAGGMAGMADPGDDDKSGFSDAFKRAAAKFGVARYLYRDGTATFVAPEPPPVDNASGHGTGMYAHPETRKEFEAWARAYADQVNAAWLDKWTDRDTGDVAPGVKDLLRGEQLVGHLVKSAIAAGELDAPPTEKRSIDKTWKLGAVLWARDPASVQAEARAYFHRLWKDEAAQVRQRQQAEAPRRPLYTEADGDAGDEREVWPDEDGGESDRAEGT